MESSFSSSYSRPDLNDDKKRPADDTGAPNSVRKVSRYSDDSEDPSQMSKKKMPKKDACSQEISNLKSKPKRPLSSYNIFFREERIKILASLPSTNGDGAEETEGTGAKTSRKKRTPHGKIGFENLGKKIGHNWRTLDEISIARYRKLADLDMSRYRAEMKEWNAQDDAKPDTESKLPSEVSAAGPDAGAAPDTAHAASHTLRTRRADDLELAQDQYAAAMASLSTEMRLMEASRASLLDSIPRAPGGTSFAPNNPLESLLHSPYNNALHHGLAPSTLAPSSSYGSDALFNHVSNQQNGMEMGLGVPSVTSEARALANLMSYQNRVRMPMGRMDSFPRSGLHGLGHLPGANNLHHPFPSPFAGYPRHALEGMRGAGALEGMRGAGVNDVIADYRRQNGMLGNVSADIERLLLQRRLENCNAEIMNSLSYSSSSGKGPS
mmetsp:Transcript_42986/g.84484  ORF Transcript_42986/g.84484 Transcript_42986/m.84484 type:complete len:438 (-) Transcript_42986:135-1448(-)